MNSKFFSSTFQLLTYFMLSLVLATGAHAVEPFQVEDIRIEGLQRA
jgi:outer membrane protein assembly factor BamA